MAMTIMKLSKFKYLIKNISICGLGAFMWISVQSNGIFYKAMGVAYVRILVEPSFENVVRKDRHDGRMKPF